MPSRETIRTRKFQKCGKRRHLRTNPYVRFRAFEVPFLGTFLPDSPKLGACFRLVVSDFPFFFPLGPAAEESMYFLVGRARQAGRSAIRAGR